MMSKVCLAVLAVACLFATTQAINCYVGVGAARIDTNCTKIKDSYTFCSKYQEEVLGVNTTVHGCGFCKESVTFMGCTNCTTDLCNSASTGSVSVVVLSVAAMIAAYFA